MADFVRVGACQTPEIIGDKSAALACMLQFAEEAGARDVDLLLFPECFLTGYILDEVFMAVHAVDLSSAEFAAVLQKLTHVSPTLVFGMGEKREGKLFNSAVVVDKGKVVGVYRKTHLITPNEAFFTPGSDFPVFTVKGLRYGINICYDAQCADAAKAVADQGAQLLLLPTQNMIPREKAEIWKDKHNAIRAARVKENRFWFVSSDVTGVRLPDAYGVERVAYGPTLAMNPQAEVVAQVPLMTVGMVTVDIPVEG